jgi:polysaccharide biosynthesis/export protein
MTPLIGCRLRTAGLLLCATVTCVLGAKSADTASKVTPSQPPQLQRRNPKYQVSRSDVIDITFPLTPEFNQSVTVQPDGYVYLMRAGALYVEGETVPQLTESIRSAYAKTLHNPVINVQLKDFQKPYFIVNGEVRTPGRYELRGDTTVTQALAIAGGFTEDSKRSEVWLFRRTSNEWVQTEKINVKKMLKAGDLQEDADLRPGDMLYVAKNHNETIKRFLPTSSLALYFTPFL